jgi:aspartate dehydrogenase
MFCPGAIGGFDLLAALRRAGSTVTVRLTSVKGPAALVRPWMSDALLATLAGLGANDAPVAVHDGSAATAATLFPQNANIAASLALAVGDWEAVTVRIVADAGTPTTIHVVEIASDAGSYRLEFRNHPSPDNPRSSALVAASVLRCIETIAAGGDGHFT